MNSDLLVAEPIEVRPAANAGVIGHVGAARRHAERMALERLHRQMLTEATERVMDLGSAALLRWAAADAAAIAFQSDTPLLVFPILFEEKSREAMERARRQKDIFTRTGNLLSGTVRSGVRALWARKRVADKQRSYKPTNGWSRTADTAASGAAGRLRPFNQ
jgi:hypothetical protein